MQPASVVPFTAPCALPDPLGTRLVISDRPGERLEQLRFAPELLSAGFEAALREQVARFAQFRHPCYARVRRLDRLEGGTALALVSEHPRGARLSDVLAVAERDGLELDINAALCIVRQLVPAVAALHHASHGAAHGTISPDRILITPHARIVLTEHVVGPAIEQLGVSRSKLWRDLRIMAPASTAGAVRLDVRADLVQMGAVSLALILGRLLRADELDTLAELLASARETTVLGRKDLVAAPLRRWLLRALQLDRRGSFESTADAQSGLDDVLSEEGGYVTAPIALESFLVRYQEHAVRPSRSPEGARIQPAPVAVNAAAMAALTVPVDHAASRPPQDAAIAVPPGEHTASDPVLALTSAEVIPPPDERATDLATEPDALTANERAELKGFLEGIEGSSMAPAGERALSSGEAETAAAVPALHSHVLQQPIASVPPRRATRERLALVLCVLVSIAEAAYIWRVKASNVPAAVEGLVSIESRPAGATVVIDDRERGVTPLSLSLTPGPHVMALRTATSSRAMPLTVQAGTTHAQYVELAPSVTNGSIDVEVGTPGARVTLDGQPRGSAPVTIADVPEGDHELVVEAGGNTIRQRVMVQAGLTTSVRPTLVETATAPPAEGGSVTIAVPFEMQVLERGRQLGTTATRRLPLAPGRHTLDIVSGPLSFRTSLTVDVVAGKETRVPVQLPDGSVAINAIPWAEVWIDGKKAGETPIGSMSLPLGPHELVFRHPDFPERRHAVSVTAGAPTRVSVEMKP
jgi:hypothetical protein